MSGDGFKITFEVKASLYDKIVADAKVGATAKVVYWALVKCCNRDSRQCNPGTKTLAKMTGLSVRTINRALKELQAAGWLTIESGREERKAGRVESNRYFFPWERVGKSTAPHATELVGSADHHTTDLASPCDKSGNLPCDNVGALKEKEEEKEKEKDSLKDDLSSGFLSVWESLPLSNESSKGLALEAYERLLAGGMAPERIAAQARLLGRWYRLKGGGSGLVVQDWLTVANMTRDWAAMVQEAEAGGTQHERAA